MKTLNQIGIEHQTDKATQFTRTYAAPHGYLPHMERHFELLRDQPITFLEIGVGSGESIRTWLEYFPKASVIGVDIVSGTNPWNTEQPHAHERYMFLGGDATTRAFWERFELPTAFDVCIDDGSHMANDIITTFELLWPKVKSKGYYIIEDLACAYNAMFQPVGCRTAMDMLKSKLDAMHTIGSDIYEMTFSRELAVLQKK